MEHNQSTVINETGIKKARKVRAYYIIPALAAVENLLIELLNHKAFTDGLRGMLSFLKVHPLAFLVNFFLILLTLAPAFFLRRRAFWCTLLGCIWFAGGVANGFIRTNRLTPFTTADLTVLNTGLETLPNYLSKGYIILLCVGLALLIGAMIWLLIWGPRSHDSLRRRLIGGAIALAISAGGLFGTWHWAFAAGHLSVNFPNLAIAYDNYGFGFCFIETWLEKGVKHPSGYSQAQIENILDGVEASAVESSAQTDVNVIFVQLESFVDPAEITTLTLSEDAVPNWTALSKTCTHGYLTVPVVGAGTANTECEVLTGMSTRFFGPGEYPYKTCLTDRTFESVAYDLKENGYAAHAIHNHRSAFYSRNVVYGNLGFDDFTGLEYMPKTAKTPINWCKDYVLPAQICKALDSTEDQMDLVFTVTVQCHGSYPSDPTLSNPRIKVVDCYDEEKRYSIEYFINQLYETDQFIGNLTSLLSKRDEKTMVVFYGDHLPSLDLTNKDMLSGSIYNAEYLIWSNFDLPVTHDNIYAYQLSALSLGKLGITNGLMNRFQQFCRGNDTYRRDLQALQYDMLYGKNYAGSDYPVADMKMGISPISVDCIEQSGDYWYIRGEGFTPYCKITVGEDVLRTAYISPAALRTREDLSGVTADDIRISIVDKNKTILSVEE